MLAKNPNSGKWKLPYGYKDLGWQLHCGNSAEIRKCVDLFHHNVFSIEYCIEQFDNSLYKNRCTDLICFCDKCKIAWHVDMSD
jgi:hypothetical protein